jgi:alcohol dehydrogenase class IV
MGALVEFTSVKPEPDYDIINALASEVRRGSFDLIVGLGGGSAMDAAKIASLLAANEKEPIKYFKGETVSAKGPPIVTIPTIAGTGSEVTPITVMVVKNMKLALRHQHLYPSLTVVDPVLAVTSSAEATASAGIDALCHAAESIMSVSSNPVTEALAFEAISLVDDFLERAYCNGSDIEARNGLAMASFMAGMAFMNTGLCLAHGIAYTYAVGAGLPHGSSVALAEPYVIAFNAPAIADKMELIAAGLGLDTDGLSADEIGYAAAERIQDIMCTLRLPTSLKDIKLGVNDIGPLVDDLIKNYSRFITENPRVPSRDDLLELYEGMVQGL